MLSLGDRNPKGTTILPCSKAYLIVPVAGNFKQFPQPLCQVALSSLSGWYANQRHREIRRALGIAQADLHSQSSPAPAPAFSFATTSTTYYYCHITGTSSSFTSSASAALTREGLSKQDLAFNAFFLFISLLYLPYFPAKWYILSCLFQHSNSRVGVSKHRFIDCVCSYFQVRFSEVVMVGSGWFSKNELSHNWNQSSGFLSRWTEFGLTFLWWSNSTIGHSEDPAPCHWKYVILWHLFIKILPSCKACP